MIWNTTRRKSNAAPSGLQASQLRTQPSGPSQQSFSQGLSSQHALLSQFSQNSLDEALTNDQVISCFLTCFWHFFFLIYNFFFNYLFTWVERLLISMFLGNLIALYESHLWRWKTLNKKKGARKLRWKLIMLSSYSVQLNLFLWLFLTLGLRLKMLTSKPFHAKFSEIFGCKSSPPTQFLISCSSTFLNHLWNSLLLMDMNSMVHLSVWDLYLQIWEEKLSLLCFYVIAFWNGMIGLPGSIFLSKTTKYLVWVIYFLFISA